MTDKEASDLIEAAIAQAMTANEDYDPNDVIVDWVAIAYVANPDREKGGGYPTFYANGEMANYRAIGLFQQGCIITQQEEE
jgi:hypothetical protein